MKILMITNTFSPHVGGVALSVRNFSEDFKRMGHKVLTVAPVFEGINPKERGVIRVPAIQKFNGSDFSVRLPIPSFLFPKLDRFQPDIIHSHHPFLLGDTALRIAAWKNVPLVFTHHTLYERYTHYVPGDSPQMKRFAVELSTGYANLCDALIAPSESIGNLLQERGVDTPISVIPTGVDLSEFQSGNGAAFRKKWRIPGKAFLVGHLGRLAPEKNILFLLKAVDRFLKNHNKACFLLAGGGPMSEPIDRFFSGGENEDRVYRIGNLDPEGRSDAYHAMNVFAFASHTETQGMVLTEALAAGVPVVALDAPGVREVVQDGKNGRLLKSADPHSFSAALAWVYTRGKTGRKKLVTGAEQTAEKFSRERSAESTLRLYQTLIELGHLDREVAESPWWRALNLLEAEWELWANRAGATRAAFSSSETPDEVPA